MNTQKTLELPSTFNNCELNENGINNLAKHVLSCYVFTCATSDVEIDIKEFPNINGIPLPYETILSPLGANCSEIHRRIGKRINSDRMSLYETVLKEMVETYAILDSDLKVAFDKSGIEGFKRYGINGIAFELDDVGKISDKFNKCIVRTNKYFQSEPFKEKPLFFWGQSNISWNIDASYFRSKRYKNFINKELEQLGIYVVKQDNYVQTTDLEIKETVGLQNLCAASYCALAQHYGLKTRLLDWSLNPDVSMFFATSSNPCRDGIVFAQKPEILIQAYYNANGKSSYNEKSCFGYVDYNDEVKRIVDSIVMQDCVNANSSKIPFPVFVVFRDIVPYDQRIMAQSGVFTFHTEPDALVFNTQYVPVCRILVPKVCKERIVRELGNKGISNSTLFPDVGGLEKKFAKYRD